MLAASSGMVTYHNTTQGHNPQDCDLDFHLYSYIHTYIHTYMSWGLWRWWQVKWGKNTGDWGHYLFLGVNL